MDGPSEAKQLLARIEAEVAFVFCHTLFFGFKHVPPPSHKGKGMHVDSFPLSQSASTLAGETECEGRDALRVAIQTALLEADRLETCGGPIQSILNALPFFSKYLKTFFLEHMMKFTMTCHDQKSKHNTGVYSGREHRILQNIGKDFEDLQLFTKPTPPLAVVSGCATGSFGLIENDHAVALFKH